VLCVAACCIYILHHIPKGGGEQGCIKALSSLHIVALLSLLFIVYQIPKGGGEQGSSCSHPCRRRHAEAKGILISHAHQNTPHALHAAAVLSRHNVLLHYCFTALPQQHTFSHVPLLCAHITSGRVHDECIRSKGSVCMRSSSLALSVQRLPPRLDVLRTE
jgi:hypothetical protein